MKTYIVGLVADESVTVKADGVHITASGCLVFYNNAPNTTDEDVYVDPINTMILASDTWVSCILEGTEWKLNS